MGQKLTPDQITDNILYYGMARQAVMNGNFDIWQRGTSITNPADSAFIADRWKIRNDPGGGTLPTSIIHSVQNLTLGDIQGSKYFYRINTNGAGVNLDGNSYGLQQHFIENGASKLCGLNQKVTVSFLARSSISNKRICPTLQQHYGTGGSPTADEFILGTPITLTSTWTKYTATFTTNTLVGKTFGTAGDDCLVLDLWYMWGSTIGNLSVQTGVSAETYVGAGNIDIAQVILNAGGVALPFQPKSPEEELRACQRYYEAGNGRIDTYTSTGVTITSPVWYSTYKRTAVVPTFSSQAYINASGGTYTSQSTKGFFSVATGSAAGGMLYTYSWTADAEL